MHNKLGFYTHDTTRQGLGDTVRKIKPLVILNHAGDNSFWRDVRETLSPNAFIIGRVFKTRHEQDRLFKDEDADPVAGAEQFAEEVMKNEAFDLETKDGHRVFDAWMSLNEAVGGPHVFETVAEMEDVYRRYDTFQDVLLKCCRKRARKLWA